MAGTISGGKLAAKTNKERHGANFYAEIGAMGGKKSRGGGFAYDREKAREAGRKGGTKSKRGKALTSYASSSVSVTTKTTTASSTTTTSLPYRLPIQKFKKRKWWKF